MENNEEWREAAKKRFHDLEFHQNQHLFDQWSHFRDLSIKQLNELYQRLGIHFDIQTSESMYSKSSYDVINLLSEIGLTEKHSDGAIFAKISANGSNTNDGTTLIPLLKSDGSTLYLTRDIAAALHRSKHYHFDRMYYVVDSSQAKHFTNLKNILQAMTNPIHANIKHLRFGRIIGMSTRRGETIFLDDVLNQAKELALKAIKESPSELVWFSSCSIEFTFFVVSYRHQN